MRGETPCRHVISPAPILTQYLSVYFSLSAEVRPNAFPTEGPSDMESAVVREGVHAVFRCLKMLQDSERRSDTTIS